MLFLLVLANFAISVFNAYSCGCSWPETKEQGGLPHFMNWMGAIMSACGFTWCYLVAAVTMGAMFDVTDEATGMIHPAVSAHTAEIVLKLGYLVIIGPILGSGLAITLQTWAYFWRSDRSVRTGIMASYNTFAQVYNTYQAVQLCPGVFG